MKHHRPILLIIIIAIILIFGAILLDKMRGTAPQTQNPNSSVGLANPASVYCTKKGGTNVIITLGNGAQDGLCQFEDNMACEEWAMYRGNCPIGGIKTTGFDNQGQKYCAWLGGKTFAVPNSQCTLPDGKVCSTDALYAGTCSSS